MPKRKKEQNAELTLADKKVILFDNFIEQRPEFWLKWDTEDEQAWGLHTKNFISECWMSLFYLAGGVSAWQFSRKQNQSAFRSRLYLFGFAGIAAFNLYRGYTQTKRNATDYLTRKYLIDESGKETGFWERNFLLSSENPRPEDIQASESKT